MPKLIANQLELEYDSFGSPYAPAVLLIMGLGTQMIAWTEEFCNLIANAGYHVIRFDNRDIGLSEKLHDERRPNILKLLLANRFKKKIKLPYSLNDMADDALGVLDALHIQQAHIVGASMGGMIAQIMTAEYPNRVLSLTSIMSSSGQRGLPRPNPDVIKQMLQRPKTNDLDVQIEHSIKTFQMIGSPGYKRTKKAWYKLIQSMMARSTYPQGYQRHMAAVLGSGSRVHLLKKITAPTLIIHGKEDVLVPVEHGLNTAKYVQHATTKIIEGMGHDLPPKLVPHLTDLIIEHFNQA